MLRALVIGETAVAMVLLVGAGLLLNALLRLRAVDPGPDPDRTLTVQVFSADPALCRRGPFARLVRRGWWSRADDPWRRGGGRRAASPARGAAGVRLSVHHRGPSPRGAGGNPFLNYEAVTPDFFRAAGLRVVRVGAFTADDRAGTPRVAVLGERWRGGFWPGADPVGQRIKWGGPDSPSPWVTVVGTVEDRRYRRLEQVSLDAYVPSSRVPGRSTTWCCAPRPSRRA